MNTSKSFNEDGNSGVRRQTEDAATRSLAHLRPGTLIEARYLVERVLGQGGMGVVLAATDALQNKRVALKFLEAHTDDMPDDFHARFALEARVCAKLRNPHIARVHEMSVWEGQFPFMVMDYLEGEDLRTLRKRGPKLPLAQAVGYAVQICEGVAEAHAHGIVHRDLKPGNIFITKQPDGSELVKVLDFGISKWTSGGAEFSELTKVGTMLGSPRFMSPEQLTGSKVDAGTDIWSIGAILYAMLTGKTPYPHSQAPQMFLAIAAGQVPAPPSTIDPSIPAAVDAVVLRCLSRERSARFNDVAELAAALLEAVASPDVTSVSGQIRLMLDPTNVSAHPPAFSTRAEGSRTVFSLASLQPSASVAQAATPTAPPKATAAKRALLGPAGARAWRLVGVLALATIAAVIAREGDARAPRPTRARALVEKVRASERASVLVNADESPATDDLVPVPR
jgi:serine/threonine protein kinase